MSRRNRVERVFAIIGAVAVVVVGLDGITFAATGSSFIIGKSNVASSTTALRNSGAGPALSLTTKSSSSAPFATNAHGLVRNLYASRAANADKLGGKTVAQVVNAAKTAVSVNTAYAHVMLNGTVDLANSSHVTQANVTHQSPGLYCIKNLPFAPHIALANLGAPASDPPASSIFTQVKPDPAAYGNPTGWGCPTGTQIAVSIYSPAKPFNVDREFVIDIK